MKKLWIILLCTISLASCNIFEKHEGEHIHIHRYDKLQYDYIITGNISSLRTMNTTYAAITKIHIEDILELGSASDIDIDFAVRNYFSDTTLTRIMNEADTKFADMGELESQFAKGLKYITTKTDIPTPRIISQFSALGQSVAVSDSLLMFSIDKYMGTDYEPYKRFYYAEQRKYMKPERIVPDCLNFYLLSNYPTPWGYGRHLTDIIMHRGKINWLVYKALGYKSISDALGYDDNDKQWCKDNGEKLWDYACQSGHMTSTDPMIIRSYTMHDPSHYVFSKNVPQGIGIWLGMKLVERYMKTHRGTTIKQLMERTDYDNMLCEIKINIAEATQ